MGRLDFSLLIVLLAAVVGCGNSVPTTPRGAGGDTTSEVGGNDNTPPDHPNSTFGDPASVTLESLIGMWTADPQPLVAKMEELGRTPLQLQAMQIRVNAVGVRARIEADRVTFHYGTAGHYTYLATTVSQPQPGDFLFRVTPVDEQPDAGVLLRVTGPDRLIWGPWLDGVFNHPGPPLGCLMRCRDESATDSQARLRTLALFDRLRAGIAQHVLARREAGAEKELFPEPDDDWLTTGLWRALKGNPEFLPGEFLGDHPDDAVRTVIMDGWGRPIRYLPWDRRKYLASEAVNPRFFDLRCAGPDGVHGTADDFGTVEDSSGVEELQTAMANKMRDLDFERARPMANLIAACLRVYYLEHSGFDGLSSGPAIDFRVELELDEEDFSGFWPYRPTDFHIEIGSESGRWSATVVSRRSDGGGAGQDLRVDVQTDDFEFVPGAGAGMSAGPGWPGQADGVPFPTLRVVSRMGNTIGLRDESTGSLMMNDYRRTGLKVGDQFRHHGHWWELTTVDPEVTIRHVDSGEHFAIR